MDKMAELLVSTNVDIDIDGRDHDGRTPIALASLNGHADIVAWLLAHGAEPNLRDLQQIAPLWHAARHGHTPVVRVLLESGRLSDVNPRPANPFQYQSETPLAIALKYDHRETAELLARADGIDPFVEVGSKAGPYETCSVLALAILRGYKDVALVLLDNRDLEPGSSRATSTSRHCDSLSVRSSKNDSGDAGSIDNRSEVTGDARSSNSDSGDATSGNNDSSDSVRTSNYARSDSLLAESINNFDDAISNNNESRDMVFSNNDDPGGVGSSNYTRSDPFETESIKLEDGISKYYCSDSSDSHIFPSFRKPTIQLASKLLVFAAGAGCYRVVQELLANHDANVNALHTYRDERQSAQGGGGVIGITTESPLFAASRKGHSSIVRLLLDTEGIEPDLRCSYVGSYGDTALALAAEGGFADVVRMLAADTRVKIDHKDRWGRTPLSCAAEYGHEAVVAELLATEAVDPDSQCRLGYTPLMHAVRPSQDYVTIQWQAQEGVVRRLLASDRVNANYTNDSGKSLLSLSWQSVQA
ncbi:HET domain-containing protein [Fusarium sp. LHS14.1]|nr:HET domain-containing protein [Fusarium sp. LHS14.1]